MAEKAIKLKLEIDSKSGEASVKRLSASMKNLETGTIAGSTAISSMAAGMTGMTAGTVVGTSAIFRMSAGSSKLSQNIEKLNKSLRDHKINVSGYTNNINKNTKGLNKNTASLKKQEAGIKSIKQHLFTLRSYYLAITVAAAIATVTVAKFFKAGFMSVEKFRLSVASAAAAITTFSDLSAGNIDKVYADAYKYAGKLALKMEIINARTIASGDQLRAMNDTFIHQGVLLDINSKKQEDAFVAIANAISLITQGQNQEIQMRQEIRGLLSGDIRATNLLAKMINVKLGGELKKNVELWKQQGTLLINLGRNLEGFKAGSADLASTWAALSTTFDTIVNRYLRQAFKPIYEDIIEMSLRFSRNLLDQKNDTESITTKTNNLHKAWFGIKTVTTTVLHIIENMKGPTISMVKFLGKALEGMIALCIAVEIAIGRMSATIGYGIAGAKLLFQYLKNIATLDFSKEAAAGLVKLSKEFEEAGIKSAGKFSVGFFDEWKVKYHEMMGTLVFPKIEDETEKPTLVSPTGEDKELQKRGNLLDLMSKMEEENIHNKLRLKYEGYELSKKLLELELNNNVALYGSHEIFYKNYQGKLAIINKQRIEEQIRLEAEAAKKHAENLQESVNLTREISDKKIMIFGNMIEQINLGLQQSGENVKTWGELWVTVGQQANDTLAGAFSDNLWDVVEGTKNGEEAFKAFGKTVTSWLFKMIVKESMLKLLKGTMFKDDQSAHLKELAAMEAKNAMLKKQIALYIKLALAKGIGGLGGGGGASGGEATSGNAMALTAKGGVFNQGGMVAFAKGGVVNSPTNFAFGDGNIGLLGEAGSEAIMPLSRTSGGELGVKTTGQSEQQQPSQTVIINAVDTRSFADVLERNPASVISIINEALQDRGPILDTIRQTL